jgi:hypothetical protein
MMLSARGNDRRDSMATTIQPMQPIAHLPLILGVLRRLEVAPILARLIPPHPEPVLAAGRGVEALVLAILDGDHALYKVGKRLEERVLKDAIGAGRCFRDLSALYQRTRQVLMAHQARPIYEFHW